MLPEVDILQLFDTTQLFPYPDGIAGALAEQSPVISCMVPVL